MAARMDRHGSGGPPHRRQSSLPASLHSLIIPGPSQPRRSTTLEETARQSGPGSRDSQAGPSRNTFASNSHQIASAPVGQQFPSLILTQAVFDDSEESFEGAESGRVSPSPPPRSIDQDGDTVARPVLSLPSRLPAWGVVRSDPVYYASTFGYPTYTVPPPGPPLPPISWPPPELPRAPSRRASPNRGDPPSFYPVPQRGPRRPSPPSPPPVAGPSRLLGHSPPSPTTRSTRPLQPDTAHSSPEALFPTESQPIDIPWRRSGDGTYDSSSLFWASPSQFPPDERKIRPLPSAQRRSRRPRTPQVVVQRRASESRHGSPPPAFPDGYGIGVGPTAYHVTTLAPLRSATVLSRAGGRVPTPGPSAPRRDFPADRRSAATSHSTETSRPNPRAKSKAARRTEAEGPASTLGKRRRRRKGEKEKEGGSSETSEYAYAPKSKKTLIACHFCRARKLRCDGQKPTCANCVRRGNACTYEPEPRRRGPAKKKLNEGKDEAKDQDEPMAKDKEKGKETAKRFSRSRRSRASGSGARARRARHESARLVDDEEEMSASASASGGLGQTALSSSSFPYTRSAFEPRLSGSIPSCPGLSYRPPSSSSSFGAAPVSFTFLSVHPGPSRNAASASAPESGQPSTASAPESIQSSTSNASAPESTQSSASASSVPDSDGAYEDMDYFDYDEFYGHLSPRGRPSQ